ncbi:MAG: outer membrane protein assembly factor BamD [Methylophaga sp.]|nr:MAG: outer membrane protein assembly factor BamD [Methylophaga sp.]
MKKYYFLIALSLTFLSGCSFFSEKEEVVAASGWTVERVYSEAKAALNAGDYTTALQYYSQLEARFPFGSYAQQSLLESAYAHYKADDPEAAIATLDRFMRVYPLNPSMDYAFYLRGLINFNRDIGLFEKYIPRDESQRDPGSARFALKDFNTLVHRFPKSKYSEDAAQRIVYLRNRLARHEINVAHYYMRRGAHIAAANRGKYVIENYPRTPAMPDALLIMAKAYKILELNDLSDAALRVLRLNYPGHPGVAEVHQTKIK